MENMLYNMTKWHKKAPVPCSQYRGVSLGLWLLLSRATSRICDNLLTSAIGKSLFLVKAMQILAHLVHIGLCTYHRGAEHEELSDEHQHRPVNLPGRGSIKASGRKNYCGRQGNERKDALSHQNVNSMVQSADTVIGKFRSVGKPITAADSGLATTSEGSP